MKQEEEKIVLSGRRKAYLWPETVVTILIVRKMASIEVEYRWSSGLQLVDFSRGRVSREIIDFNQTVKG